MTESKEANWDLYYTFEEVVYKGTDQEIKKILDQFNIQDFLDIPIIEDLIDYKKMRLLKLLLNRGVPFTYDNDRGGNALHIACGAGGSFKCVKFLIENNLLTDINKKDTMHGDTPLTLAITYKHLDIVEYFKKNFGVDKVTLDVIIDRVESNCQKYYLRRLFFKSEQKKS